MILLLPIIQSVVENYLDNIPYKLSDNDLYLSNYQVQLSKTIRNILSLNLMNL